MNGLASFRRCSLLSYFLELGFALGFRKTRKYGAETDPQTGMNELAVVAGSLEDQQELGFIRLRR